MQKTRAETHSSKHNHLAITIINAELKNEGHGRIRTSIFKNHFRGLYPEKYFSYRLADKLIVFYALDYIYVHSFSFLSLLLPKKNSDFSKFFPFFDPRKKVCAFFFSAITEPIRIGSFAFCC